ncbi:MAG: MFS transporter [Chloroflexota bacterium]
MLAVSMGIFLATIDGSIVNVSAAHHAGVVADRFCHDPVGRPGLSADDHHVANDRRPFGRHVWEETPVHTGFIVFTLGSFLCGLSPTAGWLIASRVLQGVGAAFILALGLAILTEAFPAEERGRALGIGGSIVSVGIVAGPTLGGFILEHLLALDFHGQCAYRDNRHFPGDALCDIHNPSRRPAV